MQRECYKRKCLNAERGDAGSLCGSSEHLYYLMVGLKDPNSPVECVAPDSPPPFRRDELILKQTDPTELDETGRHALQIFGGVL